MAAVSDALIALDRENRIDLAALSNDHQFIDAILEATRIALRTSKEEKLAALRNAVLNSALKSEPDTAIHEILLNIIDGLTPVHIEFLRVHGNSSSTVDRGFAFSVPVLENSPLLYHTIWKDLSDRRLIESNAPIPSEKHRIVYCKRTELGERLLKFISRPEPEAR